MDTKKSNQADLASEDYSEGSAIFTKLDDGETMILEAKESVEEIYNMLND